MDYKLIQKHVLFLYKKLQQLQVHGHIKLAFYCYNYVMQVCLFLSFSAFIGFSFVWFVNENVAHHTTKS